MTDSPPIMGNEEYRQLLEKLVTEGKGFGKNEEIVAIKTPDGQHYYITNDIQKGLELLQRGGVPDPEDPSFLVGAKLTVEVTYVPSDGKTGNGRMMPNSGFHRVALKLEQETTVPARWNTKGYTIPAGGYLIIQQRYIGKLAETLEAIRQGKETPEQALYKDDPDRGRTLKCDVFGVPAQSLEQLGYVPVALTDDTKSIVTSFRFAALPFTRRTTNFVPDHIAPERASFRKRSHGGPAL